MELNVNVTEKEILENPNAFELGNLILSKYWKAREKIEQLRKTSGNEYFHPTNSWNCSICGKSTSEVESDYLIGYDHLDCKMKQDMNIEYDNCVLCGKLSPYTRNTHIDMRIGYVEGCGQTCFQPHTCEK